MPHQSIPPGNRRLGKIMRRRLTPAELRLWTLLSRRQLEGLRFRRQVPLGRYIADFICFERKVIVELDGGRHAGHRAVIADATRDHWMRGEGFLVLRFANEDVMSNASAVCDAILAAVAARDPAGLRNPSPKPASPPSALPQGEG